MSPTPTQLTPHAIGCAVQAMCNCGVVMVWPHEATAVARTALPLFRDGHLTWPALIAACRIFYRGYDQYRPQSKAFLLLEARFILKAAETALAEAAFAEAGR